MGPVVGLASDRLRYHGGERDLHDEYGRFDASGLSDASVHHPAMIGGHGVEPQVYLGFPHGHEAPLPFAWRGRP